MTSHQAVSDALADPRIQKNKRHWRAFNEGEVPPDWPLISWIINENMLSKDGEDHTRLRRLVSKAFTPRRVEQLRPAVTGIVEALLDDLERAAGQSGDGVVDLRSLVAQPLPLTVISDLFGLDEETRPKLHRLVGVFFDQSVTPDEAMSTFFEMWAVLTGLVAAKRAEPGDDLTTALIAARDEEDKLTEDELIWNLVLFISAGYETTMNLIGNAVRLLTGHRDQLDMIVAGKAEWSEAIEEVLRLNPPGEYVPMRYTTEDMELAGVSLPKGEALMLGYASAGRDPERHGSTAGEFDITREDTSHLAFSHGRHYCLGANLARMEVNELLPRLFERFPGLDVAVDEADLAESPSIISAGVEALPVRLR
ncbi:cytochrome P450 [Nocardiopsis terrae]|uniref:Cytochrome P450 n=1 Tax=Nocardiopsis terrae TaxID=372655 RepID=A0ABR9HN69_9ACTN|nr:cytochrome P450 [Nocardiopsis terrae]MBE1460436.1 cytochrome P450 [Nocardiopsis terrae]GHC71459.1 cytochrome P450 [Nocardiopsis terrae]